MSHPGQAERKRHARKGVAPVAGQRTEGARQPKPGRRPLDVVEQRCRAVLFGGPPRDGRRLQHRADGTLDVLEVAEGVEQ